jgi:hypothetical protein
MTQLITHRGGCHCGAVRFEVDAPSDLEVWSCNCSMCAKTAFLHLIVPGSHFRLLTPREHIATYTFNTKVAKHMFCKTCGIESFYVPRSNPDGYSVNVRCLDEGTVTSMDVKPFDGRNWEANGANLADLSREP